MTKVPINEEILHMQVDNWNTTSIHSKFWNEIETNDSGNVGIHLTLSHALKVNYPLIPRRNKISIRVAWGNCIKKNYWSLVKWPQLFYFSFFQKFFFTRCLAEHMLYRLVEKKFQKLAGGAIYKAFFNSKFSIIHLSRMGQMNNYADMHGGKCIFSVIFAYLFQLF